MAAALNEDYRRVLYEQKKEVHELVMAGLEQIKEGFFYLKNTTYMLYSMIRKKKVYEVYFQKHNRIFYIAVDKENIYLLHACHKQKNKTERKDKKLVRKRASELGGQLGKKFI